MSYAGYTKQERLACRVARFGDRRRRVYSWAYNTRSPGLADQVAKLAEQVAAEQEAKSDTVETK